MLRIGFVTYLIIVTAAGQWLCCCSAGRLFASLGAFGTMKHTEPTTAPCKCCSEEEAPSQEKPAEPSQPNCPCRESYGASRGLAVLSSDRMDELLQRSAGWTSFSLENTSFIFVGVTHSDQPCMEGVDGVFLADGIILRAFHIMRC